MKVTLTNNFHGTEVTIAPVEIKEGRLWEEAYEACEGCQQ